MLCFSLFLSVLSCLSRCDVFPVEFVMRGYLTGSTSTSIWTAYARGERAYCGHALPDGLAQGDALPAALLTPTTKAEDHDEVLSAAEVLSRGLASAAGWAAASRAAHALFAFGQAEAARRGLILVDTKYEFGVCPVSGEVVLVDEVHTPDSSRYWVASTYAARRAAGLQPESVDKEFVRAWFAGRCDPYGPAPLPAAPADLVAELARRYVLLHDTITGERLALPQEGGEGAGGSEEVMRAATVAALARLRAPGGALAAAAAARATR